MMDDNGMYRPKEDDDGGVYLFWWGIVVGAILMVCASALGAFVAERFW